MSMVKTFWDSIYDLRQRRLIPRQWTRADIQQYLGDRFLPNTIKTVPYNQSITRDGSQIGNYLKRGQQATAYRVAPGKFELIEDPEVSAEHIISKPRQDEPNETTHVNPDEEAIKRAKPYVPQYLEIMSLVYQTNVANDRIFQRKYNAFYRVRQKSLEWYQTYYQYMENMKGHELVFSDVLSYFKKQFNRYEFSFSSKLLATLDPSKPIWDKYVLNNLHLCLPSYGSANRFEEAEAIYHKIQNWFINFERSIEGVTIIRKFDELIPDAVGISNTKKIDFWLWQKR